MFGVVRYGLFWFEVLFCSSSLSFSYDIVLLVFSLICCVMIVACYICCCMMVLCVCLFASLVFLLCVVLC